MFTTTWDPDKFETTSSTAQCDANPATCTVETGGWYQGSGLTGYLNYVGVWACQEPETAGSGLPTETWIGFSRCITISESATYLIGISADNHAQLRIDGVLIYESVQGGNFRGWNVGRLTLTAGTHALELFGLNSAGGTNNPAAFGAEIYGPFDAAEVATPAQMAAAINVTIDGAGVPQIDPPSLVQFSTRDLRPDNGGAAVFDASLDGSSGYSCPQGAALNLCGGAPSCTTFDTQTCQ